MRKASTDSSLYRRSAGRLCFRNSSPAIEETNTGLREDFRSAKKEEGMGRRPGIPRTCMKRFLAAAEDFGVVITDELRLSRWI